MSDQYPHELFFPNNDIPGAIRMSTAAVLLAYENELPDLPFVDEEQESLEAYVRPHAFLNSNPSGNLGRRASVFLRHLGDSLQRGEFKPIAIRRALEGTPDFFQTWILLDDFQDWCETRGVALDDWYQQYWEDEEKIFTVAVDAANGARRQLEDPLQEQRIRERASAEQHDLESVLSIIRENERLRSIAQEAPAIRDDPVSPRERTTLLNIIGVLLEALGEKESAVIAQLVEQFPDVPGVKKRTLEQKFAAAKRSLVSR